MSINRLWLQLLFRRYGVLPWVALALLLGAAVLQWAVLPRLTGKLGLERAASVRLEQSLAARPSQPAAGQSSADELSLLAKRHAAFKDLLAAGVDTTRLIETLFATAARENIVLAQAEYKWAQDADGGYRTLEMLLPVKGSYPQVRRFIDNALAAMPAAALEEAAFRRDGVAAAGLEARLRFVFFLKEQAQ